jgi:outer membrane protein OmpA-like peptidoglycan-associated protein
MSSTLIDSVKSVFTETLIAKFSVLLGEPEVNIQKAIHGAIPLVLTDIIQKAWSQEHTIRVWNLGKQAAAGDFFGRLHELTIDSGGLVTGSVLLNQGTDFAKSLLSPRTEAVVNEISRYASISIPASSFITGVVSFAALDAIGRHIASTNADANNLAIWLKSQAQGYVHSIPAGLEVKRALGLEHYPWEKRVAARSNTALYVVLVLIILGVGAFLLYRYRQQHLEVVAGTTDTTMSDTTGRVAASTDTAAASAIQVTLPNGKTLDAHKGGTEDRLVQFLSDPNAKLDKDHGNWFDFTKTDFASNSSSLLLDSEKQLKNIVYILDAFPKARIKIGGYSDNTGDSVANIRLSRERAEKIEAKLRDLGAKPVQITGAQGYGPQYPVGDNGTATGRAMNRRMSIDVKAK